MPVPRLLPSAAGGWRNLLILHAHSGVFPREQGGQIDRQTDDQTSSSLPLCSHFFSLRRLLTRFCFGTTSLQQTDSLIQPSRRLFSRSIFICATCDSALPRVPYPFPPRSLGNRTFKAAHLKAGPTQQSLMGPWEVSVRTDPL